MRSITERPVSGFVPSASTMSGQRSMRSWLFETMSTTRLWGSAARNAIVASSACRVERDRFERAGAARGSVCAQVREHGGVRRAREHGARATLSGSRSRLLRARSLISASGVVDQREEHRRELDGRQRQGAARGQPAHLDGRVAADVALGLGRERRAGSCVRSLTTGSVLAAPAATPRPVVRLGLRRCRLGLPRRSCRAAPRHLVVVRELHVERALARRSGW